MILPLIEEAKMQLFANRIQGISRFDWIRDLVNDLARRLIARCRTTFNAPAAITAYLSSNEGRVNCRESPGLDALALYVPAKSPGKESYIAARIVMQIPFSRILAFAQRRP
jgi:hypothetical protein